VLLVCEQIVVDFTATWCGPCRVMSPIFVELSKKYKNLIFLKVDVDEVAVSIFRGGLSMRNFLDLGW
jgi:thiol-disulfide isomerase/thioredoxin